MKIKAVILDLDGTLIDSMDVWDNVDVEFLAKRGIDAPENLFKDLSEGNSFMEVAKYFKMKFGLPDSLQEIIQEWTDMVTSHYENDIKLKKGAFEFILFLKKYNIKIAVGTSNSLFLTKKVLTANKVLQLFDEIVVGCKNIKGKPYPDIFLEAAAKLYMKPKNCLAIEDVLVGVKAAKNAGMKVFAIKDKHALEEKKEINELADFYADDFYQIKKKFLELL